MEKIRPAAVPLITVDPYLNVWSVSDKLYGDTPRHWTGTRGNLLGVLRIDGEWRKFMGMIQHDGRYPRECRCMEQTDVRVTPLRTVYTFDSPALTLTLTFCTPLVPSDLLLASRPVSYISYEVTAKDGREHDVEVYVGVSGELAVDTGEQTIRYAKYAHGAMCGRGQTDDMLTVGGDDRRIDYGWLHIFSENGTPSVYDIQNLASKFSIRGRFHAEPREMEEGDEAPFRDRFGTIGISESFRLQGVRRGFVCVALDDIHAINYFGRQIDDYYRKNGDSFADVCRRAVDEYDAVMEKVTAFEAELLGEAARFGGKYCDLLSLAYRQSFGAHKMTFDGDEIQFFSKECYSNGCIGTVDITYPSMPLFLRYAPALVEGMLNPVFRYAESGRWPYAFAPHDVGRYPLATGQVYGYKRETDDFKPEAQMPVEECGNMLVAVYALCRARGDFGYAGKHFGTLEGWAAYLREHGLDPDNQLCTDDFAGHLAHNVNLSAKAIMGIASFAAICRGLGRTEEGERCMALARRLAGQWEKNAYDEGEGGGHYRLAFDKPGTWSLKYNLVWDKIFGFHLFREEVFAREIACYRAKLNRYGVPLDGRESYTKSDWELWTTVLEDGEGGGSYFQAVCEALWRMCHETVDRVPFADWYDSVSGEAIMFQNRTVQGGLFIRLLPLS